MGYNFPLSAKMELRINCVVKQVCFFMHETGIDSVI